MGRPWATVRARTTLLATAITGLVLLLGSVALVATLQALLTSNGDDLARARVRDLLTSARAGRLSDPLNDVGDESVAQVISSDGRVLAASANVRGRPALSDVPAATALRVATVDGPDDDEVERYRVWAGQGPTPSGPVTVLVGTSLESVREAATALRWALLGGVPLLLLLLGTATWSVLGRALRRIDTITLTVAGIGEGDLDRRVPTPGVDDEVGRLADTMNGMLHRLQQASLRQRGFVADASHDLQSPLAALRAQLEVAAAHPDGVEVRLLARDLLINGAEMEALVRDLLYLAAQDHDSQVGRPQPVDLDDLVLEEAARVRGVASQGLTVRTTGVSAAPVLGDPDELRRLVRNLLDNAVGHARAEVELRLGEAGGEVVLDVLDDGPGVPPPDLDRVFDRFYRGDDPARSRRSGSGLGLAIARGVARDHGGDVEALGTGRGHFRVRLPAAT